MRRKEGSELEFEELRSEAKNYPSQNRQFTAARALLERIVSTGNLLRYHTGESWIHKGDICTTKMLDILPKIPSDNSIQVEFIRLFSAGPVAEKDNGVTESLKFKVMKGVAEKGKITQESDLESTGDWRKDGEKIKGLLSQGLKYACLSLQRTGYVRLALPQAAYSSFMPIGEDSAVGLEFRLSGREKPGDILEGQVAFLVLPAPLPIFQ